MTDPTYKDWKGLAQAIKSAAAAAAKTGQSSLDVNGQIAQAHYDRFLSRVFADGDQSEWLLKGGTAMLARVPKARTTKDVDLTTTDRDLDDAQDALATAASRDLGDHVRFQLTSVRDTGKGQNQPGVATRRLLFTGHDTTTGRRLFDVPVDLAVAPPPVGRVETTEPAGRLHLPRPLESHPYRLFPIADQAAEKVIATVATYDGRPSSRTKDLVDLVITARTQRIDLRELQRAIDTKRTLSRIAPFTTFTTPDTWERPYLAEAAKSPTARGTTFTDAQTLAAELIDPALAAEPVRDGTVWLPGTGWTDDPTPAASAPVDTEPAGGGDVQVTGHMRSGHPVAPHTRRHRRS